MGRTPLTPLQRAGHIADRQRGLITLEQAVAAGLSDDQAARAVVAHGWTRLARGLYALPGSTRSWQRDAMAAVLLCGDDAVASHVTAAALWGWCAPPVLPHATAPRGSSTRTKLVRLHRSTVPARDTATRDGIRCTSASRTLVDVAGLVERARLEGFVDDALCAAVASPPSVRAAADRAGRRGRAGMAALDGVLDIWTEDIRPGSPAEMRLLRRLVEARRHRRRHPARGPGRRRRVRRPPRRRHARPQARPRVRLRPLAQPSSLGPGRAPVRPAHGTGVAHRRRVLLASSTRLEELLAPQTAAVARA